MMEVHHPEPRMNDRLVVGMTSADRIRFVVFAQRAGFRSVSELARRILLAYVDEQEAKEMTQELAIWTSSELDLIKQQIAPGAT